MTSGPRSLLQWAPGHGRAPRLHVLVESLKYNDLALPGPGLGEFWPYGSLIDAMAGEDATRRRCFQADFRRFLADGHPARLHPACPAGADPDVRLYTYRVPGEWAQEYFLNWYRTHRGHDDFLEPAGRKNNDYRGNQQLLLLQDGQDVDEAFLRCTSGQVASFSPAGFRLMIDNRYNPYRWVGPINDIQHHEQAALCLLSYGRAGVWDAAEKVLRDRLLGGAGPRLLLEYDLVFRLDDYRAEMGEHTIWDFYGGSTLDEPMGVVSQTHFNALKYMDGAASHGHRFAPGQSRFVQQWVDKRYVAPNVQLSLMVNFLERYDRYRLAEFMLASYNQAPIFFFDASIPVADHQGSTGCQCNPFLLDGPGVIPTANQILNPFIVDGGCSGPFAWTRTPVDAYVRPDFWDHDAGAQPIILQGGNHVNWDNGWPGPTRLQGVIDLTAFYVAARRGGYFPGQRGFWGSHWVGFEGDLPQFRDPEERHGLEWAGIIIENHGPFRAQLDVAALDVRLESD